MQCDAPVGPPDGGREWRPRCAEGDAGWATQEWDGARGVDGRWKGGILCPGESQRVSWDVRGNQLLDGPPGCWTFLGLFCRVRVTLQTSWSQHPCTSVARQVKSAYQAWLDRIVHGEYAFVTRAATAKWLPKFGRC